MNKIDLGVVIFYVIASVVILTWTIGGKLHLLGRTRRFGDIFYKTPAGTHVTIFVTASSLSALVYLRWFSGYSAPVFWMLMLGAAFLLTAAALELQFKALKRLDNAEASD